MGNTIVVLTSLLHGLVKLAGLTPQTIEIEPGTLMNIWVPKETVTKNDQNIVYVPPTKPAVILLHPFGMDGIFTWFLQVFVLTRAYAVYVPDLLFFGGSITDRNERSASFQAEFVAKGLGKLKVEKVTVVGVSYGGMVGFKMAKLYPKLVNSMVVSGTVIELTESISRNAYDELGLTSWSDLLMPTTIQGLKRMFSIGLHKVPWVPDFFYGYFLEGINKFISKTFFHGRRLIRHHHEHGVLLEAISVFLRDRGKAVYILPSSDRTLALLMTMFSNRKERNELLRELVVADKDHVTSYTDYPQEIHMVWGDDDKIFNLDLAMTMKTQLGDKTTLEWIKDAGHLVQFEQPFKYNKHLKRILERVAKNHGHDD